MANSMEQGTVVNVHGADFLSGLTLKACRVGGKLLQQLLTGTHTRPVAGCCSGRLSGHGSHFLFIIITPHSGDEEHRTSPALCGDTVLLQGQNGLAAGTIGTVVAHEQQIVGLVAVVFGNLLYLRVVEELITGIEHFLGIR